MTLVTPPDPDFPTDPALAVAERQLVMLRELAEMAMTMSRAYLASGVASADAAKAILVDKYFMPEVGRANACGAKDAAESFQKVTRSLRLTLMLEKATAEFVRDLRAGVIAPSTAAAASRGAKPAHLVFGDTPASTPPAPRLEADDEGQTARLERPGAEREQLDVESSERLAKGFYRSLVDDLAADVRSGVDWESATLSAPDFSDIAPPPHPIEPGKPRDSLATSRRELALSP